MKLFFSGESFYSDLVLPLIVVLIGTIAGVAVRWIMKRIQIKKKKVPLFKVIDYSSNAKAILSFADQEGIKKLDTIGEDSISVKAEIDFSNKPRNRNQREFAMVFIEIIPEEDWQLYAKRNYVLEFDIASSGINAVQLEMKNATKARIIDKYIPTKEEMEKQIITLKDHAPIESYSNVSEICFTVFCEEAFIQGTKGQIEICDLTLRKL